MATSTPAAVPPRPEHPPEVPAAPAAVPAGTAPAGTSAAAPNAAPAAAPAPEAGTGAGGLAGFLAPVQPVRTVLGTTADLAPQDGTAGTADAETGKADGKNGTARSDGKDDSRDGPLGALVRALAQRLGRTGTATTIKRNHEVKETRVSGSSTNTTNANKSDRLAKNENTAQHRSQRDAKVADLNNKTHQHQHQGKDNRDVRKNDSTDAKTAASKASKSDTASKTGKDSRDSTDTKSADTKSSKNDTASKTGKDSRDSTDTKSADTKSSKNDTASKTGKDSRDSTDTKSADTKVSKADTSSKSDRDDRQPDGKAAKTLDGKSADGKTPKDGQAGAVKPEGPDKEEKAGAGGKPGGGPDPRERPDGRSDPGPDKGPAAPKPGGPAGVGGGQALAKAVDAKGGDTKFRGAKTSSLVGATPEPTAPATTPDRKGPDRKGPDDKFRTPRTTPDTPVKPGTPAGATARINTGPPGHPGPIRLVGREGPRPDKFRTPKTGPVPGAKTPKAPVNGPAARDGRTTMNKPNTPGMVPVSGSTAGPAAGNQPGRNVVPPRPAVPPRPTQPPPPPTWAERAEPTDAVPVEVLAVGRDAVVFAADGVKHSMSRGEVRTLKQFEMQIDFKGDVLALAAEGCRDTRAAAVDHATRAQRLAEQAREVKGGQRLVAIVQRLAEQAQTLQAKAEEMEKRAGRGQEAVKVLAANARVRHDGIYQAVVNSPLTSPAEREFYQDKQGS